MDHIADAVGVSRRTVFRYFTSKNDIVWGDFATVRARLRAHLAQRPPGGALGDAIRRAVIASNHLGTTSSPSCGRRWR